MKLNLCQVTNLFVADIQNLSQISDPIKVKHLKSLVHNWQLVEWIKDFKSIFVMHAWYLHDYCY